MLLRKYFQGEADEYGPTFTAGQFATAAFTRVWDNPADADYEWMVLVLGGRLMALSECGTLTVTEPTTK